MSDSVRSFQVALSRNALTTLNPPFADKDESVLESAGRGVTVDYMQARSVWSGQSLSHMAPMPVNYPSAQNLSKSNIVSETLLELAKCQNALTTAGGLGRGDCLVGNTAAFWHSTLSALQGVTTGYLFNPMEVLFQLGWELTIEKINLGGSSLPLDQSLNALWLNDENVAAINNQEQLVASNSVNDLSGESERLLSLLKKFPRPNVSTSDDGETAFFWFNEGDSVDAYLDQDGHLTWIGKFNGKFDRGGDEVWRAQIPDGFVRMLTRLYK